MKQLVWVVILCTNCSIYCQDTLHGQFTRFRRTPLNSVQLELLGIGGVYSLNYERILIRQKSLSTTAQIGLSFWGNKEWKGISFPFAINEQIRIKYHQIEFGFGVTPNYVNNKIHGKEWDYFLTGRIGYRYHLWSRRFIFRAGYTPVIYPQFMHWAGISFGYSFQ